MIQLEKRYRLPVAVCLEEEKIYMPNQKDLYGKEEFEMMKREIKGILEWKKIMEAAFSTEKYGEAENITGGKEKNGVYL